MGVRFPLVWIAFLLILMPAPVPSSGQSREESAGAEFHLDYRALQPGEVLLLKVDEGRNISSASASFRGKKYPMAGDVDSGRIFTLIGLDLDLDPGIYPLKVVVQYANGQTGSTAIDVIVKPKAFPEEKLWVEEKFVTPPGEVRERIQWESELLRSIYSISSDRWLGGGSFILPLEGRASNNFGKRRIFNNLPRSPHSGQDISSPSGTPVAASNSGRVVLAKDLYFSGNTVIIDHGLGVFTYYCHFSEILSERGDWVRSGDVIGRVGATGRVTGPHLHWSVRIAGSRVDPYSLCYLDLD
jgi:murein DD-endopeptidase MepM/ murein hydrolase activator NlpD